MRSEVGSGVVLSHPCAEEMAHGWGIQFFRNLMEDCACLRERSGWRWELSFI